MLTADQIHAEVDRYRRHLVELYDEVRRWVANRYPTASFGHSGVDLSEEATGVYQVQSLDVSLPGLPALRFVPRGIFMVGAHGRVDVRSRLGREVLVWLEPGGPAIRFSTRSGDEAERVISRSLFPNISEGWAWSDYKRNEAKHLDEDVFWNRLLGPLTQ
jgi:hypothetical protein